MRQCVGEKGRGEDCIHIHHHEIESKKKNELPVFEDER